VARDGRRNASISSVLLFLYLVFYSRRIYRVLQRDVHCYSKSDQVKDVCRCFAVSNEPWGPFLLRRRRRRPLFEFPMISPAAEYDDAGEKGRRRAKCVLQTTRGWLYANVSTGKIL
jgi:hypothetical protein